MKIRETDRELELEAAVFYHDMSWWGAGSGAGLVMVAVWCALLLGGLIVALRLDRPTAPPGRLMDDPNAERVLAERFARGEIDEAEYLRRLTVLRTQDQIRDA